MATDPTTIPSTEDLQQAKKDMTDINTFTLSQSNTFTDSNGGVRKTITGIENEADRVILESAKNFNLSPSGFDFATGGTLTSNNQTVTDGSGNEWIYTLEIPKGGYVVAAGTDPNVGDDYKQVSYSDHNNLSNRNATGAHDASSIALTQGGSTQDAINYVTPDMFGIVEGFDAGNAVKIESMIESGLKIKWGLKSYGVDRCIGGGATLGSKIDWESDGCEVFLESSSSHQQAVLWYEILPVHHNIVGELTFNANSKANVGAMFDNLSTPNYPLGYASWYSNGLKARNIRRELGFNRGTGIYLSGAFTSVVAESSEINDCVLATGAGVPNVVGISGFDVVVNQTTGGVSRYTKLSNLKVSNVISEDPDYDMDMDGVRLFGVRPTGAADSSFTKAVIDGAVFENCWGRSIKTQTASTTVRDVDIYRNAGGNTNGNVDIDSQLCIPTISNVNCYYDGFVPTAVIGVGDNEIVGATTGSISDVSINGISGTEVLPLIAQIFTTKGLRRVTFNNIESSNIEVINGISFYATDDDSSVELNTFDLASVDESLVLVRKGGEDTSTATLAEVEVNNVTQHGAGNPQLVKCRVSGVSVNAIVNTNSGGIKGFTQDDVSSTSSSNPPAIVRAGRYGNDATNTSYLRVETVNLASGETKVYPRHGVASGCCVVTINSGIDKDANGQVSLSTNGVDTCWSGANLGVGDSSEPASGELRVWQTNGQLNIKNSTASSKVVTLYFQ